MSGRFVHLEIGKSYLHLLNIVQHYGAVKEDLRK